MQKLNTQNAIYEMLKNIGERTPYKSHNGNIEPSRSGVFLYKMNESEEVLRGIQLQQIAQCIFPNMRSFLDEKIEGKEVWRWLGLLPGHLDLLFPTQDDSQNVFFLGLDLCGGDPWRINDINCDGPGVVGYQEVIMREFQESGSFNGIVFRDFGKCILETLCEVYTCEPKDVFLLYGYQQGYAPALQRWALENGCYCGVSHQLTGKEKVILRLAETPDILSEPQAYVALYDAIESGVPVVNPLHHYIGTLTAWPTLLKLFYSEKIRNEWFPQSWIVSNGIVLDDAGERTSLAYQREQWQRNREDYVLKGGYSTRGSGVYIGKDTVQSDWEYLLWSLKDSNEPWVIERFHSPTYSQAVQVGEWVDQKLILTPQTLQMIQRVYMIFTPDSNSQIFSEMFGNIGNKINAAGYAFPVAFVK